ncbi:MAG: type II toxin-antitoxin system RelE/ParE family toxin [Acidaminococcaceae bacterium]|nr:type II toxin-antitoxin system RelE/ParE family toxin [Acidaminococcaceae bacterium]MBR1589783.1 type II toxin-antitoxin system RelE/ParE family toxin [Acidaminococcaceae bacterium]
MKHYKMYITIQAQADLRARVRYLHEVKRSVQAAQSLLDDYVETRAVLSVLAGAIADPSDEKLKRRCLKRINFIHHNYFMLFKVEDTKVIIVRIFHGLEDYKRKLQ